MVIDEGRLVEFDHAAILLQRPESIFYDLVKETGMFETLLQQAKIVYHKPGWLNFSINRLWIELVFT